MMAQLKQGGGGGGGGMGMGGMGGMDSYMGSPSTGKCHLTPRNNLNMIFSVHRIFHLKCLLKQINIYLKHLVNSNNTNGLWQKTFG